METTSLSNTLSGRSVSEVKQKLVIKSKKYNQALPFLKMNYKITVACALCKPSGCCTALTVEFHPFCSVSITILINI